MLDDIGAAELHRRLRRPHRIQRPRGGRGGDDGRRARPHGRVRAGRRRPRDGEGRAARGHRALRAHGRPHGDPRPAAAALRAGRGEVAADWRRATTRSSRRSTIRGSRCSTPCPASNRFIPPSGHIAGVWARNDNERGVHKAPANEVVRGAVELQTQLTRTEQELLNPIGVNAIRSFPGPRHPRLGCSHALERSGVAVRQRPPAVQLPREVDPERDAVRGVRAQRPRAVGQAHAGPSRASSSASGARARCSGGRPTRPSS